MLFDALELDTPIAGFNGGLFVKPDLSIIEQKTAAGRCRRQAIELIRGHGLDAWVYRGNDWLITKADAPHVAREAWTVKFEPKIVTDVDEQARPGLQDRRRQRRSGPGAALRGRRPGGLRRARDGQPLAALLSRRDATRTRTRARWWNTCRAHLGVPAEEIATIGDQPNDVLDVQALGLQHRHGQCVRRGQGAGQRRPRIPTTTRASPRRWNASFWAVGLR